jgi:hypothetical protein
MHTTLVVVELIIIEVYGSTVFGVAKIIYIIIQEADSKGIADCFNIAYVSKYLPKLIYFTYKNKS